MSVAYAEPPVVTVPRGRLSTHVRPAPPLEPPYEPLDGRPSLRVIPGLDQPLPFERPARRGPIDEDFWGPQHTQRRNLPDPTGMARSFLQAAVEVVYGRRSTAQLTAWATHSVVMDLSQARRVLPAKVRTTPPVVQSVHISEPADGVAEVCAVLRRGERYHAMAARLEGVDGRWRCVKLQLG